MYRIVIDEDFKIPSGTPQQRRSFGRRNFPSQSLVYARAAWQAMLERNVPDKALHGPVKLCVVLYYHRQSGGKGLAYKTTRPDGDNILKLVKDIMTQLRFWDEDDSHVSDERIIRHVWSNPDRVVIYAEELLDEGE